jgi:hypothetical protein
MIGDIGVPDGRPIYGIKSFFLSVVLIFQDLQASLKDQSS